MFIYLSEDADNDMTFFGLFDDFLCYSVGATSGEGFLAPNCEWFGLIFCQRSVMLDLNRFTGTLLQPVL